MSIKRLFKQSVHYPLKPSGYYMYHQVSRPTILHSSHRIHIMFVVWYEQTSYNISLHITDQWVLVVEYRVFAARYEMNINK